MITVVEFYGVMGGGKTTLAGLVETRLEERRLDARRYPAIDDWIARAPEINSFGHSGWSGVFDIITTIRVGLRALALGGSVRPRGISVIRRVRRLTGWYRRTQYLRHLRSNRIAIQDEGVLHTIMPIVMYGVDYSPRQLDRLATTLAKEDHKLFVFVRTDRDLAIQRLRRRGGLEPGQPSRLWMYEQADPQQEHEIMERMETMFDRIDASIAAVAPERRFVVANVAGLEEAADAISSFIAKSLDQEATGP